MTILIIPTGVCNLSCSYCFEPESLRRGTPGRPDVEAIATTLDALLNRLGHQQVGLHGGECTLVPQQELEALLRMIAARTGKSAVQTNGHAITSEMIRLFQEYNTTVSVSCDGPEELNLLRGPNPSDAAATYEYNQRLSRTIEHLSDAGLRVGIACVLHKANAGSPERLDRMKGWMVRLAELGIRRGRVNPLFTNPPSPDLELTADELVRAYRELFDFVVDAGLEWLPFREMVDNLLGFPVSPCFFAGCNKQSTFAISILPDGRLGNCDRTFVNGLQPRPTAPPESNERDDVLRQTHCRDCRFWAVCRGGCPVSSEGLEGGLASKPRFCETYYKTYEHVERRLRGLLPNIKLVVDGRGLEPFEAMSWHACRTPSSYSPPVPRNEAATAASSTEVDQDECA